MARVRYLGWENRKRAQREHGIVTAGGPQLKKTVHPPGGRRLVFRGRSGKSSQWRTVEDREAIEYFEKQENFEVRRE